MSAIITLLPGLMIGRTTAAPEELRGKVASGTHDERVHQPHSDGGTAQQRARRLCSPCRNDASRGSLSKNRVPAHAGIRRRYLFLTPASENDTPELDSNAFYVRGQFPSTAVRMRLSAKAPELAEAAVDRLKLGSERNGLTHLLITCCTGFTAPGLDLELVERCGLRPSIERTMIGFMGRYAEVNALKLARHIVRSNHKARILIVNFELCTLHLQDMSDLAKLLTFLLWLSASGERQVADSLAQ